MKHKIIVPYGGGYDSTSLLILLNAASGRLLSKVNRRLFSDKVKLPITIGHIDYGQKASSRERIALEEVTKQLVNLDITPVYGSMDLSFSQATILKDSNVGVDPKYNVLALRNPLIISYLASLSLSTDPDISDLIFMLGYHVEPQDSPFHDAKTHYLESLSMALSFSSGATINVEAPLSTLTRQEIFNVGRLVNYRAMNCAYTCYEGIPCVKIGFKVDPNTCLCSHCSTALLMMENYNEAFGEDKLKIPSEFTELKSRVLHTFVEYLHQYVDVEELRNKND